MVFQVIDGKKTTDAQPKPKSRSKRAKEAKAAKDAAEKEAATKPPEDDALAGLEEATPEQLRAALKGTLDALDTYFAAIEAKKAANRAAKDAKDQGLAALQANVEESQKVGEDPQGKLNRIIMSYQDYKESLALAKDSQHEAIENLKVAQERVKEMLADSRQLTLPGV